MLANLTSGIDLHSKALMLRAERQRIIASNIANADTPGYVARDLNFRQALTDMARLSDSELAQGLTRPVLAAPQAGASTTQAGHIPVQAREAGQMTGSSALAYTVQTQPAVDGNSVDLDRERANFVDNSVRYESTLRFISGQAKTLISAIQGQ